MFKVKAIALAIFLLGGIALTVLTVYRVQKSYEMDYGVIIDAGSTSCKVHVFSWPKFNSQNSLPVVTENLQITQIPTCYQPAAGLAPGIATFANNLDALGPYLSQLLGCATDAIPSNRIKDTQLFLYATAGMREISLADQESILNYVAQFFRYNGGFQFSPENARVIPGADEGLYGWITTNFVYGKLTNGQPLSTYGALDLGGASTQLTFVPDPAVSLDPQQENTRIITMAGTTFPVYANSFLYYGRDAADYLVNGLIIEDLPQGTLSYSNPCYPSGFKTTYDSANTPPILQTNSGVSERVQSKFAKSSNQMGGEDPTLARPSRYASVGGVFQPTSLSSTAGSGGNVYNVSGSGDYAQCTALIDQILNKTASCADPPCSFNGVNQPPVRGDFIAFSNFFYTESAIATNYTNLGAAPTLSLYASAAEQLCGEDWTQMQHTFSTFKPKYVAQYCFNSAYAIRLLSYGYGFPTNTSVLNFQTNVNGIDLGWALGAMLYQASALNLQPQHTSLPLIGTALGATFAAACLLVAVVLSILVFKDIKDGKKEREMLLPTVSDSATKYQRAPSP